MSNYPYLYDAFVRDTNDPEKRGRVRCFCPAVMGDTDNRQNWLGWADVTNTLGTDTRTTSGDSGSVSVPEVGTLVVVAFRMGEPDFPIVLGVVVSGDERKSFLPKLGKGQSDDSTEGVNRSDDGISVPKSAAGSPTYTKNRLVKTSAGHLIELDDSDNNTRIRIRHSSGSFSEWTHAGSFVKQVIGDILLWVGSSIKIRAVSDIILSAGGSLLLGGSTANKKIAHEDSYTESHTHVITPVDINLVAGSVPVTGTITMQSTTVKINSATCASNTKVKP